MKRQGRDTPHIHFSDNARGLPSLQAQEHGSSEGQAVGPLRPRAGEGRKADLGRNLNAPDAGSPLNALQLTQTAQANLSLATKRRAGKLQTLLPLQPTPDPTTVAAPAKHPRVSSTYFMQPN